MLGVSESPTVTPGLQCCLLCGRTLTNRELHDAIEERVLRTIRSEHPEWTGENGTCETCVVHYRELLKRRSSRADRLRAHGSGRLSSLFGRLLGRSGKSGSDILDTEPNTAHRK